MQRRWPISRAVNHRTGTREASKSPKKRDAGRIFGPLRRAVRPFPGGVPPGAPPDPMSAHSRLMERAPIRGAPPHEVGCFHTRGSSFMPVMKDSLRPIGAAVLGALLAGSAAYAAEGDETAITIYSSAAARRHSAGALSPDSRGRRAERDVRARLRDGAPRPRHQDRQRPLHHQVHGRGRAHRPHHRDVHFD